MDEKIGNIDENIQSISDGEFLIEERNNTVNDDESFNQDALMSESHASSKIDTEVPINMDPTLYKNNRVELYAEDKGPKLYPVRGNIVTPLLITKNLPQAFRFMPIYGRPKTKKDLEKFQRSKVREFVGCDLNDEEFNNLVNFCSPSHLKMGTELTLSTNYPTQGPLPGKTLSDLQKNGIAENLCIVKKLKLRLEKDTGNQYTRQLKYRGVRCFPTINEDDNYKIAIPPLEPGKDLIFRVRVYRPFFCSGKERNNTRHSILSHDIVLLGRQKLTVLRDRIVCANDVGMRIDVSENPDELPPTSAKEMFPSGFLFINNTFYVDVRKGCKDNSKPIREWAQKRQMGQFPHRDMELTLDQLPIKLGHPEVYVHQGSCEHLFTFSEVRLLGASDPLRQSLYPFHTAISQNQTIYCTTCAEFGAKWIVTGCSRVPFDPAFFCETCLKLYLYHDGKKICDFKAYLYRGNEINVLKPPG
ncbi:unnamed protein product, partial [Brenthis ino]